MHRHQLSHLMNAFTVWSIISHHWPQRPHLNFSLSLPPFPPPLLPSTTFLSIYPFHPPFFFFLIYLHFPFLSSSGGSPISLDALCWSPSITANSARNATTTDPLLTTSHPIRASRWSVSKPSPDLLLQFIITSSRASGQLEREQSRSPNRPVSETRARPIWPLPSSRASPRTSRFLSLTLDH